MPNTFLSTEEQRKCLLDQLRKLEAIESKELASKHYPAIKHKYEGKFFKVINRYNSDKHWWLYTKIVQINPTDIYDTKGNGVTSHFSGWSFETDPNGNISIENIDSGYVHSIGKEITEKEFNTAWNKMVDAQNKLK